MNKELALSMDEVLGNELADRHSLFQLQFFVIGKEPTTQAKLWRCVKELQARKDSIESLKLEIEDAKDKILLLDLEGGRSTESPFGIEESEEELTRREINNRRNSRHKKSLENTIVALEKKMKYVEEEAEFFVAAYKSLSEKEPMKSYDDENAQMEYWNEKLSQEMGLRGLIRQPLDIELVRTILSLDDRTPIKKKTTEMLERAKRQIVEAQGQGKKISDGR